MLSIVIFLCIITVVLSIVIGFMVFKGYALIMYYIKKEEDFSHLHSKIRELEVGIQPVQVTGQAQPIQETQLKQQIQPIQQVKKNKPNIPAPKIVPDHKIYSQKEFSKAMNNGKVQMSSMLKSKLNEKE